MTDEDMGKIACDAVKREKINVNPASVRATSKAKNFLDGVLFFVSYQNKDDVKDRLVYVYLKENDSIVINSIEDLSKMMTFYRPERSGTDKLLDRIFSLSIVPPVIALVITAVFCYSFLRGQTVFPEVMSNALTLIIGFYFGSIVTKRTI